jgi:hypothetical protein
MNSFQGKIVPWETSQPTQKFPVPAAVAQRLRRDGKASKLFRLGPIILWFRLHANENGLISKIRTRAVNKAVRGTKREDGNLKGHLDGSDPAANKGRDLEPRHVASKVSLSSLSQKAVQLQRLFQRWHEATPAKAPTEHVPICAFSRCRASRQIQNRRRGTHKKWTIQVTSGDHRDWIDADSTEIPH